jgi:hypothetical protein
MVRRSRLVGPLITRWNFLSPFLSNARSNRPAVKTAKLLITYGRVFRLQIISLFCFGLKMEGKLADSSISKQVDVISMTKLDVEERH